MRLGVHVSIAGGFSEGVERALTRGCQAVQIFGRNPRGWAAKDLDPVEVAAFHQAREAAGLFPLVIHAPYLINLGGQGEVLEKSLAAFAQEVRRADALGADFLVFHPGSASKEGVEVGIERVVHSLRSVLDEVQPKVRLLLENVAGSAVGSRWWELREVISQVGSDSLGVCLDTCHALAAGYELRTPQGVKDLIDEIDEEVGLQRLQLLHLNDSQGELGSHLDRHAHIGEGTIGVPGFQVFFAEPRLRQLGLAGIAETPGDEADDRRNLAALKEAWEAGV